MRGVQFKTGGSDRTTDISLALTSDDNSGGQARSSPGKKNQPDDVDALVSGFLNQLNALSNEWRVASDSSSRNDATPSTISNICGETPAASSVFGRTEGVLHREPEVAPAHPDAEIAPEQDRFDGKQTAAGPPTVRQDAEVDDSRPSQPEIDTLPDASPNQNLPAVEIEIVAPTGKVIAKQTKGEAAKQAQDISFQLRGLFQEKQKKRSNAFHWTVTVVLLVIVLTAAYLFYGFKKSIPPPAIQSTSRSTPVSMPAEPSAPGEYLVRIPALKGRDRSGSEIPAKSVMTNTIEAKRMSTQELLQIIAPVAITKVIPPYPQAARSLNIFGQVELEMVVDLDEKGNVVRATAIDGPALFSFPAEQALLQWRFKPAVEKGINVPSTVRVTLVFKP